MCFISSDCHFFKCSVFHVFVHLYIFFAQSTLTPSADLVNLLVCQSHINSFSSKIAIFSASLSMCIYFIIDVTLSINPFTTMYVD